MFVWLSLDGARWRSSYLPGVWPRDCQVRVSRQVARQIHSPSTRRLVYRDCPGNWRRDRSLLVVRDSERRDDKRLILDPCSRCMWRCFCGLVSRAKTIRGLVRILHSQVPRRVIGLGRHVRHPISDTELGRRSASGGIPPHPPGNVDCGHVAAPSRRELCYGLYRGDDRSCRVFRRSDGRGGDGRIN